MKPRSINLLTGSVFAASIFVGSSLADATTYSYNDDTFGSAKAITIYHDPTGTAPTLTLPCAACGTGGGADFEVVLGTASTAFFIAEPNWIFDPATQGAVTAISGSIDRRVNTSNGDPTSAVLRLAIEQGGNYYFTSVSDGSANSGTYYTLPSGPLAAADFGEYDTNGFNSTPENVYPDLFEPFELGYLLLAESVYTSIITSADFDNLDFSITTTPLPAALPLFATGLGALGLLGWRRKRKSRVSLLGVA